MVLTSTSNPTICPHSCRFLGHNSCRCLFISFCTLISLHVFLGHFFLFFFFCAYTSVWSQVSTLQSPLLSSSGAVGSSLPSSLHLSCLSTDLPLGHTGNMLMGQTELKIDYLSLQSEETEREMEKEVNIVCTINLQTIKTKSLCRCFFFCFFNCFMMFNNGDLGSNV